MMAFVVVYDACVLYPAPLRDLLVRLASKGVVRARWSEIILDECFRNILEQRPDLKPEMLRRTRELMTKAVADSIVTGFEGLVAAIRALLLAQSRKCSRSRRRLSRTRRDRSGICSTRSESRGSCARSPSSGSCSAPGT